MSLFYDIVLPNKSRIINTREYIFRLTFSCSVAFSSLCGALWCGFGLDSERSGMEEKISKMIRSATILNWKLRRKIMKFRRRNKIEVPILSMLTIINSST